MSTETIRTAPSVDKAIEDALTELGVSEDEIKYEVLTQAEKKLFGKDQDAVVRVWVVETNEDEDIEDLETKRIETDLSEDVNNESDKRQHSNVTNQEELSEEDLDRVADAAIETIRGILVYFDADGVTIDEYEGDNGEIILDIIGDNLAILIGRHGKTLDALQFLTSSIVNRKMGFRFPIVVDVEGYKHRRKQKLESLAKASATRAVRQGGEVKLRPMTPYERRIIHITLKEDKRVTTSSEGEEPNRFVVIRAK